MLGEQPEEVVPRVDELACDEGCRFPEVIRVMGGQPNEQQPEVIKAIVWEDSPMNHSPRRLGPSCEKKSPEERVDELPCAGTGRHHSRATKEMACKGGV